MVDKLRKVQFKYLNYLFEDMYPVKSKYYPDSTFFKKKDKVTLELEKSGTLWVLYSVWTSISDMFSLDYSETQQLIKAWMEQQIKSEKVAPTRTSGMYDFRTLIVEEQLKSEEVTPTRSNEIFPAKMELQLKSVEITPLQGCVSPFSMDGEELTPQRMDYVIIGGIEEGLEPVEITPKNAMAPPSSWRKLDSEEVTPKQAVFPIEYPEEITPEESIPLQSWRDLEKKEITPRSAIAPPFRWRELDSVKYAEIKPTISTSYRLEEKIKLKEITPQVNYKQCFVLVGEQLNYEEQIIPEKTTCFVDSVRWKKIND